MIRVDNITHPHKWDELYDIHFKFTTKVGKRGSTSYLCENISTIDDETSSGLRKADGNVVSFDRDKYDAEFNLPYKEREYQKFVNDCTPVSCIVCWQWAIESFLPAPHKNESEVKVFMGRTAAELEEFAYMVRREIKRQSVFGFKATNRDRQSDLAQTNQKTIVLKIFDHHLGFEMGTLFANAWHCDMVKKGHVFAREAQQPMKIDVTRDRVRMSFCDTIVLTQKSLYSWTHDEKVSVMKLKEDQNFYEVMRNPLTELDDEFVLYSINDVYSMCFCLEKLRERYGSVHSIPLTQTACVRLEALKWLTEKDPDWCERCCNMEQSYGIDLYRRLISVFAGGYTHGSNLYTGSIIGDTEIEQYFEMVKAGKKDEAYNIPGLVHHYDFCSSYPSVATRFKLGIGEWRDVGPLYWEHNKDVPLEDADDRWFGCFLIKDVTSKLANTYWSHSKCIECENPMLDNGRIESCDSMLAYFTDYDMDTFRNVYNYSSIECIECFASRAGYISKELILFILDLFHKKNLWKGVEELESQLMFVKQQLNAVSYGCAVFKEIGAEVSYTDDGWVVDREQSVLNFDEHMAKKVPEKCFWGFSDGVFIVSIARWCLWQFIQAMDPRIIYCDTDSIFVLQNEDDIQFVHDYNERVREQQEAVANALGFDPEEYLGCDAKGKKKRLGCMEEEPVTSIVHYGAKKYAQRYVDYDKKTKEPYIRLGVTVSGLPKAAGVEKIKKLEDFTLDMLWTTSESHKLTPHYRNGDQPISVWTDYQGHVYVNHDMYGIALLPTTFSMSITPEYYAFIEYLLCGTISDFTFFKDTPKTLLALDVKLPEHVD